MHQTLCCLVFGRLVRLVITPLIPEEVVSTDIVDSRTIEPILSHDSLSTIGMAFSNGHLKSVPMSNGGTFNSNPISKKET
jgi:hypothetical protein